MEENLELLNDDLRIIKTQYKELQSTAHKKDAKANSLLTLCLDRRAG